MMDGLIGFCGIARGLMTSNKFLPLVVAGFLLVSSTSFAQIVTPTTSSSSSSAAANAVKDTIVDQVCDPEVFARMKLKAWMEAQRENYINQSIITKPDSVFAQSCYDKQLGNAMQNLGVSEDGTSNTTTFQNAVAQNGPVAAQFAGVGTGNTITLTRPQGTTTAVTTTYNATPSASSSFSCDVMQKLWQGAQCGNFASGNLPTLKEAGSTNEARNQPVACTTGKTDPSNSSNNLEESTLTAMFTPPASFSKVDNKFCATQPYSKLTDLGCEKKCWPGIPNGTKNDAKKDVVTCQPGCKADPGNSPSCVPE